MKKNKEVKNMTFEEALSELEFIVDQLEHGDVPLEQSINIYERSTVLREKCNDLLRVAEARIEKISLSKESIKIEPMTEEAIVSSSEVTQ